MENALKTAWKMLVHNLGGVDAVAACTRAVRSRVSEYGNVASDRWPPIDIVLTAEKFAGEPFVTKELARAQGFKLVALSEQELAGVHETLGRVAATSTKVITDTISALGDGVVSQAENEVLDRGLDDLERATQLARAALRRASANGHKMRVVPQQAAE